MSARQKRSSGGYGLRRKVAKKRLDEDFEYYFSKIGTPLESKSINEESNPDDEAKVRLVVVTELLKAGNKADVKNGETPGKRPRGRPRKIQVAMQDREPDISHANLKFVDLKEKRIRKPKIIYIDENETSKAVDEICGKEEEVVTVAHEEVVEGEACVVKHLKLEAVLADEITGLQEEEVSSLPEGEKENLPEDGVNLNSDSEERVIVQMDIDVHGDSGEGEEGEMYEVEEIEKDFGQKIKRKYRRNRLSHDTIRKLSQLSPDDKIECNECHKLLKPSSFRQHLRTHTGEKPFGCDVCDARFTRKGDVERHVRIVHNKQKPFKCCRCQRAFGDKKNLRWHLMNHDKKLFYVCEVCGFKFGKREYWENHVRFIHPLPGGVDPSEIGESGDGDGDDRLRALTETLLGEDETALDITDQNGATVIKPILKSEQMLDDCISPEVMETVPIMNQTIKPSGLKCVNLKSFNVSNLVKIARPTGSDPSHYMMHNQPDGIDAVVIQFSESGVASSTVHTLPQVPMKGHQHSGAANMVRVDMLQLVQGDGTSTEQQPIVIDTHNYGVSIEEGEEETVTDDVSVEEDDNAEYMGPEPGEVISVVLNEDQGASGETNNSNVQTLIEALLDAAKGDDQTNQANDKST